MDINNIHSAIRNLSEKRRIFHSEADFQFAFAWELQKELPHAEIRLEYPIPLDKKLAYMDILVIENDKIYPIELKYKTKSIPNCLVKLKNQGAQDIGRYDFISDIKRIEGVRNATPCFSAGYVIMLTNDELYWRNPVAINTFDSAFRIHQNRVLKGVLDWAEGTGVGTKKERPLMALNGIYTINWHNYYEIEGKNGKFMYNVVEVQ